MAQMGHRQPQRVSKVGGGVVKCLREAGLVVVIEGVCIISKPDVIRKVIAPVESKPQVSP